MAKLRIINETGQGWNTKVIDEFGHEVPNIKEIRLRIVPEDIVRAEVIMIMPSVDVLVDGELENMTEFGDKLRRYKTKSYRSKDGKEKTTSE